LLVFIYLLFLSWMMVKSKMLQLQNVGKLLVIVLLVQVGLGISNIIFSLPLWVAVAHNGVAALLLLIVVTANHIVNHQSNSGDRL